MYNFQLSNNTYSVLFGQVIYLVRDPRGIFCSRLRFQQYQLMTQARFMSRVRQVCTLFTKNINFIKNVSTNPTLADTFRENFILVRHEDIVQKPLDMAEKIYRFVGIAMAKGVKEFAQANVIVRSWHAPNLTAKPLSQMSNLSNWQINMGFEKVLLVQRMCTDPMQVLGYHGIENETDLKNAEHRITGQVNHTVPFHVGLEK